MHRKLLERLMIEVPQEKYYGNPFKFILENWDGRGKELVRRFEHEQDIHPKEAVEPAKIAHDIWVNMMVSTCPGRHSEIVKNIEDFHFILKAVTRMYAMSVSERQIKDAYYHEVFRLKETRPVPSGIFQMTLGIIDHISRDEQEKHDHVLQEQMDNDIKEHQRKAKESRPEPDWIDAGDGPDLHSEGDK